MRKTLEVLDVALIKCSECGKEISTTAERCPHCGHCTNHGRSVVEAKMLLAKWIICAILIVCGFVMVFANAEMFFEVSDSLQYYKSWSESGKEGFWKFAVGALLVIGGFVNMVLIKKETGSIKENGFASENGTADGWVCVCGRRNAKYVSTCVCGKNKNDV